MLALFCLKSLYNQIVLIVYLPSDLSIDFSTGYLLKDLSLGTFVAFKELCELTLGEHGRAAELIEVESYSCRDDSFDIFISTLIFPAFLLL